LTFLGYRYFPENEALDCVFDHQEIYAVIEMKDKYYNPVLIRYEDAW
jgi:hypothetical protein